MKGLSFYRENTESMGCIFMYWGCGTKVRAAWKLGLKMGGYMRFNHTGILIFLVFCLQLAGPAHAVSTDDILTIYKAAEASDPALAAAKARLNAVRAQVPLAKSKLLPKLTTGAELSRKYTRLSGAGPDEIRKYYWGDSYSVRLVQPVFDGQAYVNLKMAGTLLKAEEAEVIGAKQNLILRVFKAYFKVLQARADVRVAEREKDLLKTILDRTKRYLEVGTGDVIAVKEARARYDAASSELISAQNRLSVARKELELLAHRPVGVLRDVGSFTPLGPQPSSMEPWIKSALENQPVLARARKVLEASRQQIELARRERWPRLDLEAGAGFLNGGFLPDVRDTQTEVGLVLSVPLYLGGAISAKTSEAEAKALESRHRLDQLRDHVTISVESAFLGLRDSVAQLEAARQRMESARISMDATNKGYALGTRTIIDTLDTTHDYFAARRDYYVALYNHILARVRLKAAVGIISKVDVEAINGILRKGEEG